ncbi:MAG TPA: hypothetical protein PLD59_13455 [Tepidisphaeraceae bacterium]|nr:hypothetical protein [Tepidisphaeraceae bacterium]
METPSEHSGSRPAAGGVDSTQTSIATLNDAAAILADRERRREHRRPAMVKASIMLLDGPSAGSSHDVLTRESAHNGVSFLLREGLTVGSTLKMVMQNGKTTTYVAEVIRARPLSNGKHEMAVTFRK